MHHPIERRRPLRRLQVSCGATPAELTRKPLGVIAWSARSVDYEVDHGINADCQSLIFATKTILKSPVFRAVGHDKQMKSCAARELELLVSRHGALALASVSFTYTPKRKALLLGLSKCTPKKPFQF